MTQESLQLVKTIGVWSLIITAGLLTVAVGFVSLISVWVGITHMDRAGAWAPISAGALVFAIVFWSYISAARALRRQLKTPELFEI